MDYTKAILDSLEGVLTEIELLFVEAVEKKDIDSVVKLANSIARIKKDAWQVNAQFEATVVALKGKDDGAGVAERLAEKLTGRNIGRRI